MHKITVIGNLGTDPEMRYTPGGTSVTSFSLASNRRYKTQDGEQREETTWFRVSCWRGLADVANNYLNKGSQVYIEGRMQVREYQRNDGTVAFSLDVTASEMQLLGSQQQQGGGQQQGYQNQGQQRQQGGNQQRQQQQQPQDDDGWDDVDDLPF